MQQVCASAADLKLSFHFLNQEALLMQTRKPINIPVVAATQENAMTDSNCSGNELVALMVLGDSMMPEFIEGEILVIEMGAPAIDDSFVISQVNEEFIFRQLKRNEQGGWLLHALNSAYPDVAISGLDVIKGVVTHKKKPGSRKSVKYYVPHSAY
jgi:SOS-response transcriptional repressor LexA